MESTIFCRVLEYASVLGSAGEVWFRGHANAEWQLTPSLFRFPTHHIFERDVTQEFKRRAIGIIHNAPGESEYARWLFLMQHHGLKTRLLDWSESALAAFYFAAAPPDSKDGVLYLMSPSLFNARETGQREVYPPDAPSVVSAIRDAFLPTGAYEKTLAFKSWPSNERIARQMGHLSDRSNSGIMNRIEIPRADKSKIRTQLEFFGINRTTLFHDLDSLADDINKQYFIPVYDS